MRTSPTLLTVVLVVLSVGLAGCIGSGGQEDPGTQAPAGDGDDGEPGPTGQDGQTDQDGDGDGATGDGTDGDGDGGDAGQDNGTDARTPADAMPGYEPVETGEGFAHFRIEDTADLAFRTYGVAHDLTTYAYNLTTLGDEVVIEALLTWDEEMVDLNLHVLDDRKQDLQPGNHGQKWLNDNVCGHIGECTFLFAPNGTTWEHIYFGPDALDESFPGAWTVEIREVNNWDPASVQAYAGLGEGAPYTLDVWVYTVPTDEVHGPPA